MTITELATKCGVSRQAVYKRLKAAGMSIDALKEQGKSDLTEQGAALILSLFEGGTLTDNPVSTELTVDTSNEQVEQLTAELATVRKALESSTAERDAALAEIAALKQACEVWTARADAQQELINVLMSERDFLRVALEREQQNLAQLPPPRGVSGWLHGLFRKGK